MITSIESRLWLAVHLLYPNASQAFDVYQAVSLQSEQAIASNDTKNVFSRLVQVYEKIPAISSNLAFYEFEFEEIDQWKVIYKNSQKAQLVVFIGVLIFEMKITEIAAIVKLPSEKAQFLFQQIFKKLASSSQKLKYSEQLEFKKQNDNKISYLFTYENLVDYCLEQLSKEEKEKVEQGLTIYPMLIVAKEEYTRIIRQIQNLKVQKERAVVASASKPHLKILSNDGNSNSTFHPKTFSKMQLRFISIAAIFVITIVSIPSVIYFRKMSYAKNSVVLHEIEKADESASPDQTSAEVAATAEVAQPVAKVEAAQPLASPVPEPVAPAANPAPASSPAPKPNPVSTAETKPEPKVVATKVMAPEGGLYRGTLTVKDLNISNEKIKQTLQSLGAVKAGEVELGWLKTPEMAYYHYTILEKNIASVEKILKQAGVLKIKFEPHPRKVPAGNKRFIIEVKQN